MNLIEFSESFPDELSCKARIKEIRDTTGVVCSRCDGKTHCWKKDKEMYECKSCGHRTSLKSGTVMHKSRLPYRYLSFGNIHQKRLLRQRNSTQPGHKRYQPIWHLVHKIRACMGMRDDSYTLCGTPELDEGFFTVEVPADKKEEPGKRGRGSQSKANVLVMVESEPDAEQPAKGKGRKVGYLKMQVITDLKSKTITEQAEKFVSPESRLDTDDSTSYTNLRMLWRSIVRQGR